jgi:2-dehydro-3-deoxyphosphogluconate aldolase / (4S)-4-hydroxy-2-oxoglutarate aldolase
MDILSLLHERRVLAIVRGSRAEAVLETVLTLAHEGIGLIEVSLTSDGALDVIARARGELGPEAVLGAGTVLTARAAREVRDAGAEFIVTPGLSDAVAQARSLGMPTLVGALTPSEVIAARAAGADAVKVFPASALGGPAYLRALRAPFPDVPFLPVGGVDEESGRRYLADGAVGIGVGSPLIGDAADGGDLEALRGRIRAFLRVAEESQKSEGSGESAESGR